MHECCGLHHIKEKAWPFQDQHHAADACATMFGRQESCFGAWRRDEQVYAGLLLLVAVVSFLIKVSFIVLLLCSFELTTLTRILYLSFLSTSSTAPAAPSSIRHRAATTPSPPVTPKTTQSTGLTVTRMASAAGSRARTVMTQKRGQMTAAVMEQRCGMGLIMSRARIIVPLCSRQG